MSTEFLFHKPSCDCKETMEMFAHINIRHLGNKIGEPDLLVQDVKPATTGREQLKSLEHTYLRVDFAQKWRCNESDIHGCQ